MNGKKKVILGQFFTKDKIWLREHIIDFINSTNSKIAYDPYAGGGHLLDVAVNILGFENYKGLDIDNSLEWKINDSLLGIPHIADAIIITNPPYLSNYSASRKKIGTSVEQYFETSNYDDVYLIALDKMNDAQKNIVAIIPETFINSNYKRKNLLNSITILEDNPFDDTDTPVLVACFDGIEKDLHEVKVYKNDTFVNFLGNLEDLRLIPNKNLDMSFNDLNGWLGVRCVDTTNIDDMLRFDFKENIDYDWKNKIKGSSRLLTLINIEIDKEKRLEFINECNKILNEIRKETDDIIFSPFKGNMKNGRRRRRLDFITCRAIMERAHYKVIIKGDDKK